MAVRRLRPPDRGRLEVWDAALPGFGVRITENGKRSFVLLTRLRGRPLRLTWSWPATPLAAARDRARDAIQKCARGEDPRVEKRPVARTPPDSVEAVAAAFVEQWCTPRNRSWEEQERLLRTCVLPVWQGRRLAEIQRADVVALVDALACKTPTQANRVLATLKTLFRWALDRDLMPAHPAVGLKPPGREKARERVLTDTELVQLWQAWDAMAYPWGRALQVLLLTATRRSEVEHMTWGEIDTNGKLWTIPGERTKTALVHTVPLADPVLRLLAEVPQFERCAAVFSTRGEGPIQDWSGAVERSTKASGVTGWRVHDLRRTARTGLARLGVPADIGERVLGHVVGGVRGVYDRHQYLDAVRAALDSWAARVTGLVAE